MKGGGLPGVKVGVGVNGLNPRGDSLVAVEEMKLGTVREVVGV